MAAHFLSQVEQALGGIGAISRRSELVPAVDIEPIVGGGE
jgi:hypothetical protein